jgi:hypothetical protein
MQEFAREAGAAESASIRKTLSFLKRGDSLAVTEEVSSGFH